MKRREFIGKSGCASILLLSGLGTFAYSKEKNAKGEFVF